MDGGAKDRPDVPHTTLSNVVGIDGGAPPARLTGAPNPGLVCALEDMVEMARRGELQSFIGTGFVADGARLAIWFNSHPNAYEMLGAIAWLEHEYVAKQSGLTE